jgi:hypothetical protein
MDYITPKPTIKAMHNIMPIQEGMTKEESPAGAPELPAHTIPASKLPIIIETVVEDDTQGANISRPAVLSPGVGQLLVCMSVGRHNKSLRAPG